MAHALRIGVLAAALTVARTAHADDSTYQDFPVGGRALGLGGAFAALGNDPSGIYYNPAGLVDSSRASVQVSANLYGLEIAVTGDILDSVRARLENLERVFSDLSIVPTSAGFTETLGDKDDEGRYQHAWGAGVFVPSARSLNLRTVGPGEAPGQQISYRHLRNDRTIQGGASYSYRIDEVLRFGVSGLASVRTLRDHEQVTLDDGASGGDGGFRIGETTLDLWVAYVALAFGVKLNLDEWHFGATLTTPSIHLQSGASIEVLRAVSRPDGGTEFRLDQPEVLDADTQHGTSLRLGAAYVIDHEATYALDVVVYAPVRYRLLDLDGVPRDILPSITVASEVERRLTINASLGAEFLHTTHFSTAFGLFTNLSSAPPIPEGASAYTRDAVSHIDHFGGTAVLGFFGDHTLTRIGLLVSLGIGEDLIPESQELTPLADAIRYQRIEVTQLFVYFFLSSTFRY